MTEIIAHTNGNLDYVPRAAFATGKNELFSFFLSSSLKETTSYFVIFRWEQWLKVC